MRGNDKWTDNALVTRGYVRDTLRNAPGKTLKLTRSAKVGVLPFFDVHLLIQSQNLN